MSLAQLPPEVLYLIEGYAKVGLEWGDLEPSLQLCWVCQHLRVVFMPRFWSFVVILDTRSLARSLELLKESPLHTYSSYAKCLEFGGSLGMRSRIDPRLYDEDSPPTADEDVDADDAPAREPGEFIGLAGHKCGPRTGEAWPQPMELFFSDPRRLFKLAGKKEEAEDEDESDETGSSAASGTEEAEASCKICHPSMHKLYRHRVKPDDYWLPGAVHSAGPLHWERRTWGRYLGPDADEDEKGPLSIKSVEEFLEALTSVVMHLHLETFAWNGGFSIPTQLCEQLSNLASFHRLALNSYYQRAGSDCFSSRQSLGGLLLLAPNLAALQEKHGTDVGAEALEFSRDSNHDPIFLPLSDYPPGNSMRGFMDFLLAAKKLKHLSTSSLGVFVTPCLLGVFARLHSVHWCPGECSEKVVIQVRAISKLRESLWQLTRAVGRPGYLLEAADVQLLSRASGEHADIAFPLAPLSPWLAQAEWAALVAQGWNDQEELGPNEDRIFHPPYFRDDERFHLHRCLTSLYEDPRCTYRS